MTKCIGDYSEDRYAILPGIYQAYLESNERMDALWALGSVICDHGLEEAFGLALLHKHFELRSGERLVRHYGERSCEIRPQTSGDVVSSIWAVADRGGLAPIEFTAKESVPSAIQDEVAIARRSDFVAAFSQVAHQQGVAHLFGIAALHGVQHMGAQAHETVVETETGDRGLRLNVVAATEIENVETAQTLWMFSRHAPRDSTACPIISPDSRYSAHCYHCRTHCTNPVIHR